jgi:flagellar assembly factor FliW
MKIETARFGELSIEESGIYYFAQGIPGFEEYRRYVLLQPSLEVPFCYLQSVEDGDLAFLITDPFLHAPNYEFELPDSLKLELRVTQPNHVSVWAIVTASRSLEDATMNLMAPLVLNVEEKLGKQVILHDSGYAAKHPLMNSIKTDRITGG